MTPEQKTILQADIIAKQASGQPLDGITDEVMIAAHYNGLTGTMAWRTEVPTRLVRSKIVLSSYTPNDAADNTATFTNRALLAQAKQINLQLMMQGIETLGLRMERHCRNALAVARFLAADPRVDWVNFPGLPGHPQHALLGRQMRQVDGLPGGSGLLAFGVRGGLAAGVRFIEAAQFMSHLANIGDTRTLIIHPASTTHRQLDDAQQRAAGVLPDMVRISVGLEHIDDILWDIDQALDRANA
mgnify:CR=1 FL=1